MIDDSDENTQSKTASIGDRVEILSAKDDLLPFFRSINEEWIDDMFEMEKTDRDLLNRPRELILNRGGKIYFARHPQLGVVGTCALLKHEAGIFELTKMGVLKSARGLKAGDQLLRAVLREANKMVISELFLLTNHRCEAAIHLYYKHGFRDDDQIMQRYGLLYDRCDVAMRYICAASSVIDEFDTNAEEERTQN